MNGKTLGVIAAAAALGATITAPQAETFNLTVTAGVPPVSASAGLIKKYFVPEINKQLAAAGKHKINWTEAYSATLASLPETLEAVENGIAHFGLIILPYEEAKLPLEQVSSRVFFGPTDPRIVNKAMAVARAKIPALNAAWEKNGNVVLVAAASDSYELMTKFPVKKFEDIKGHKIGATGAVGHIFRGTGAVVVNASIPKAAIDIRNGVYEGYYLPLSVAFPFKVHQSAPIITKVGFGAVYTGALSANRTTWMKLPADMRSIIMKAAAGYGKRYTADARKKSRLFTKLMVKGGAKTARMTALDKVKWARALPNVAKEWAQARDKEGLPGTELLKTYMDAARDNDGIFIRDWDKE